MGEPVVFYSYEDMVIKRFKEDKELALRMIAHTIEDYKNGEDDSLLLLRKNLSRFIVAYGYDVFESAELKRKAIDDILQTDVMPTDKTLINQMLDVLDIKERI